jgi:hypothetical protein
LSRPAGVISHFPRRAGQAAVGYTKFSGPWNESGDRCDRGGWRGVMVFAETAMVTAL